MRILFWLSLCSYYMFALGSLRLLKFLFKDPDSLYIFMYPNSYGIMLQTTKTDFITFSLSHLTALCLKDAMAVGPVFNLLVPRRSQCCFLQSLLTSPLCFCSSCEWLLLFSVLFLFVFVLGFCLFWDRVSLFSPSCPGVFLFWFVLRCSPGYPGTH